MALPLGSFLMLRSDSLLVNAHPGEVGFEPFAGSGYRTHHGAARPVCL